EVPAGGPAEQDDLAVQLLGVDAISIQVDLDRGGSDKAQAHRARSGGAAGLRGEGVGAAVRQGVDVRGEADGGREHPELTEVRGHDEGVTLRRRQDLAAGEPEYVP